LGWIGCSPIQPFFARTNGTARAFVEPPRPALLKIVTKNVKNLVTGGVHLGRGIRSEQKQQKTRRTPMLFPTRLSSKTIPAKPRRAVRSSFPTILFLLMAIAIIGLVRQTYASGPQCSDPYVQVQGAAPAATDPTNQYAIQRVNIGEPFSSCFGKSIRVVLKVPTMDPGGSGTATPPPDSIWIVRMTIPGSANSTGQPQNIFLTYDTSQLPQGAFDYGWQDSPGHDCSQCALNVGGVCSNVGTVAPDGTITMDLNLNSTVSFGTCAATGGTNMTVSPSQWTQGTQLTGIQGQTKQRFGGLLTGVSVIKAQTTGDGAYTVQGNVSCSNPPVAVLAAAPVFGSAPLLVNFDATGSNVPAGGCGTINSYIFDFGDGSGQVAQASPMISHTYTTGGVTYPARVRVTSTAGLTSSNIAEQDITVNTAGPPLIANVGSRVTHNTAGDFDVNLNLPPYGTGNPRGVECRNTGGSYSMVFTFVNNLISVASPTVTTGTVGSVSGALGPNANQYTVTLTGVGDQQYVGVTLIAAHDATGATGNEPEVQMGVLVGDDNGSGRVDAADVSSVRQQTLQTITVANFRNDLNASGRIDASDVSLARQNTLHSLPSTP
jgi:hypothetical protein